MNHRMTRYVTLAASAAIVTAAVNGRTGDAARPTQPGVGLGDELSQVATGPCGPSYFIPVVFAGQGSFHGNGPAFFCLGYTSLSVAPS